MSVSSSFPPSAPLEAIDSIFTARKGPPRQRPGSAEVIYTIASAVHNLEGHLNQQQQQNSSSQHQQGSPERSDIISALTHHNNHAPAAADANQSHYQDGSSPTTVLVPNGIKIAIHEMARRFRPYNAPPAPEPISDAEIEAREAENAAAEAGEELQARELEEQIESQDSNVSANNVRRVIITVHEAGDLESPKFFTSHSAPLLRIEDPESQTSDFADPESQTPATGPRSSGGRLRIRGHPTPAQRQLWRERFLAISVKRQRRLKMKKHKYKKLMRKTRNLRRRLDKL